MEDETRCHDNYRNRPFRYPEAGLIITATTIGLSIGSIGTGLYDRDTVLIVGGAVFGIPSLGLGIGYLMERLYQDRCSRNNRPKPHII